MGPCCCARTKTASRAPTAVLCQFEEEESATCKKIAMSEYQNIRISECRNIMKNDIKIEPEME